MNESEIVEYYRKLVTVADSLVPIEWSQLVVGAYIDRDRTSNLLFFYSTKKEPKVFISGLSIPRVYNFDRNERDEFDTSTDKINDIIYELQQWFIDNNQEVFHELMIHVNDTDSLNSKIGYIDWTTDTEFNYSDQIDFFEYKYLNVVPNDKEEKKKIKEMEKYESEHR